MPRNHGESIPDEQIWPRIYVAKHPKLPGFCAAYFADSSEEAEILKAMNQWKKRGYTPEMGSVSEEVYQAGASEFLAAKRAAEKLEIMS